MATHYEFRVVPARREIVAFFEAMVNPETRQEALEFVQGMDGVSANLTLLSDMIRENGAAVDCIGTSSLDSRQKIFAFTTTELSAEQETALDHNFCPRDFPETLPALTAIAFRGNDWEVTTKITDLGRQYVSPDEGFDI